jgi:uncharacterized RDD family membrane protein YckC
MENNYEKRIGFGTRVGAKLVDSVILIILALFIVGPILGSIIGASEAADASEALMKAQGNDMAEFEAAMEGTGKVVGGFFAGLLLALPITGLFYGLIEGFTGASPAKMMFGIKVGNEDGTTANVSTYMKRWAIYNSSFLCSLIALLIGISFMSTVGSICGIIILIGCFFVLAEPKQSFHGKWSQTAIFNKADLS